MLKKDKRYRLDVDLTEDSYNKLFYPKENERLSRTLKEIKIKLNKYENNAEDVVKDLESFTFDVFERKYFRDRNAAKNAVLHYHDKINRLTNAGKIGTADSYKSSLKSIDKFLQSNSKKIEA